MQKELRRFYPQAMINITNKCTLRCKHCFIFREGNPNSTAMSEMSAEEMIKEIEKYIERHGIYSMIWMGGEPLLRTDVLKSGVKLFPHNVITTNGTLPLINLGPKINWVISIDGPEKIHDEIRGKGTFKKVIENLMNLPDDFEGIIQCQCIITKMNEDYIEELVEYLMKETPIKNIIFAFYVPSKNDTSEFVWKSLQERDSAVKKAYALKKKYPTFIYNKKIAFKLLLSQNALEITNNCLLKKYFLPIYLGENGFEIPYCCHGNDVNCDMCGSFGVFQMGAMKRTNPIFRIWMLLPRLLRYFYIPK